MSDLKLTQKGNYFYLEEINKEEDSFLATLLCLPIDIPRWIVSFFFARLVSNVALNASGTKKQRDIHLVHLSESKSSETQEEIVVVNLLPRESHKTINDYLLQFNNAVHSLPNMDSIKRRELKNNALNQKHIDSILAEVEKLLEGTSTKEDCQGKVFSFGQLHFKGLECMESGLQDYFKQKIQQLQSEQNNTNVPKINLNFFTLQTKQGYVLDSVETSSTDLSHVPMAERNFVISCLPREQNYIAYIKDSRNTASKIPNCSVIGFNYDGADQSKGLVWTEDNMINDIIGQVERLICLGAKPERIGLEGTSLGGSIATIAAARLHKQGIPVQLYAERPFRNLARFVSGYVMPSDDSPRYHPMTILRTIVGYFAFIVLTPIFWLTRWSVNTEQAWNEIPEKNKFSSVIRGDINKETHVPSIVDGVVHDSWASITTMIERQQKELLAEKKKTAKTLNADEQKIADQDTSETYFVPKSKGEEAYESQEAAALAKRYGRFLHFYPRYKLVHNDEDGKERTMHDAMCDQFDNMFNGASV